MQITLEIKCPTCLSESIKKNGFKLYGKQKYQCKNCKRHFIGDHALSYRGSHSNITCSVPMKEPKYTPEIRGRTVQLLIESEKDYPSNLAAITAIAPKIGCTPETLRARHQKHLDQQNPIKVQQISDQEKMKQMEREIKELKRANEILRKAAAFFAQAELDRPHK